MCVRKREREREKKICYFQHKNDKYTNFKEIKINAYWEYET